MKTAWTELIISSILQKGGWSYLPLSKPFLVPHCLSGTHSIPLLFILSAFHLQMEAKCCSSNHPSLILSSIYSTSSIIAPLHALPLPDRLPAPLLSQFFELSASTLEGPFPPLWGCLPWNCPWCQKWGLLPWDAWHWSDWLAGFYFGVPVVWVTVYWGRAIVKSKGDLGWGEIHGGLYWWLSAIGGYHCGQLKLDLGQALEIIRG